MIKEMTRLQIIGAKALLDETIKAVHAIALIQIEAIPYATGDDYLKRFPFEKEKIKEKEAIENSLEEVKNLLFLLPPHLGVIRETIDRGSIPNLLAEIKPVGEETKVLCARRDTLREEFEMIERYEKILRGFAPIVGRLGGLKNFDIMGFTIERSKRGVVLLIEEEMRNITEGTFELHTADIDEHTIAIVAAYPRSYSSRIRRLVAGEGITEIKLPLEYEDMPLVDALKTMVKRKELLPSMIKEADHGLAMISERWHKTLKAMESLFLDMLDEIGAIHYCATTRFCFVIEGWAPKEMMEQIKKEFKRVFEGRVFLREMGIKKEEEDIVPVYIKNPEFLKPFEVFLKALPTPRYTSVDPTPYIAVFFPVFFGIIVGDIGYGIMIFIAALLLNRRFKHKELIRDISTILSISAVTSIIFGVLFGEFFGDLGERLSFIHPIVFDRIKALKIFMVLTLGIGIGHVGLGFVIAVANYIYRGKTKEAVGRLSHFLVLSSILAILGVVFNYIPKGFMSVGLGVLVVGFVLLLTVEGVIGPLELIRTLGNVLSYVRIMALGTVSVVMALVANKMGGLAGSLYTGIMVAILIHAFNIMLTLISPVVQSMRLQYVEFLSKFYEGGGRRYEPFRRR